MYKKLLVSLLSVALVASLFCGCAKSEVAQTSAQNETKVELQNETQAEIQFTSGVLYSASLTEEEQNDTINEFEWGTGINVKYFV